MINKENQTVSQMIGARSESVIYEVLEWEEEEEEGVEDHEIAIFKEIRNR